jgi:hypothetical protein
LALQLCSWALLTASSAASGLIRADYGTAGRRHGEDMSWGDAEPSPELMYNMQSMQNMQNMRQTITVHTCSRWGRFRQLWSVLREPSYSRNSTKHTKTATTPCRVIRSAKLSPSTVLFQTGGSGVFGAGTRSADHLSARELACSRQALLHYSDPSHLFSTRLVTCQVFCQCQSAFVKVLNLWRRPCAENIGTVPILTVSSASNCLPLPT